MVEPEQLGQLFVVGVEATGFDDRVRALLEEDRVGGLILFQRNLRDDLPPAEARAALAELIAAIRQGATDAGLPTPFLMIDHEGGRVHRFGESATRFPPPGELAPLGPARVAEVCRQQADEVRAIGFNTILGPVLDVCPAQGTQSHIASRSYSGDPEQAAALGALALRTFLERGLLPVPKHFPGYGAAPIDPHLDLPTRTDSLAAMTTCDLVPFARAAAAGCPALMTAHIVAAGLDAELPCTLSKRWLDHVRDPLGFQGCLVSDDLCMASVRDRYGPPDLAQRTLRAGLDLLLVCHPTPGSLAQTRRHLLATAAGDPSFAARLLDARRRVEAARALLDATPAPPLEEALFATGERLRGSLENPQT
jgi:beta-N-acetylhexosaminidase